MYLNDNNDNDNRYINQINKQLTVIRKITADTNLVVVRYSFVLYKFIKFYYYMQ